MFKALLLSIAGAFCLLYLERWVFGDNNLLWTLPLYFAWGIVATLIARKLRWM